MKESFLAADYIQTVSSFEELVATQFRGTTNALCWKRELKGDFAEIVAKLKLDGNMVELSDEDLQRLQLSERGQLAREILLNDLQLLKARGTSPVLNVISNYEKDDASFFPTDVYSFHVDRSPVPTDTYLCTYYGAPSEILLNEEAEQKILIPEIRNELRKLYRRPGEGFETFLTEHFFDLHYRAKPNAQPISLGLGNLWKLATNHPGSPVLPCVHRAPPEKTGEKRLLLIC